RGGQTMDFDPYESWLGIPSERRPLTFYDLLGLATMEADPSRIELAASERMELVRQYEIGPHSDLSRDILTELAYARLVLMDAGRRAEYDAELQSRAVALPDSSDSPEVGEMPDGDRAGASGAPDFADVLGVVALEGLATDDVPIRRPAGKAA